MMWLSTSTTRPGVHFHAALGLMVPDIVISGLKISARSFLSCKKLEKLVKLVALKSAVVLRPSCPHMDHIRSIAHFALGSPRCFNEVIRQI